MNQRATQAQLPPHVLIFPYVAHGHVNPMLKLAELLCLAGVRVTFIITEHILRGIQRHRDVRLHFERYSGFRLETISDGLPDDLSSADRISELFFTFRPTVRTILKELVTSNRQGSNVTCVIADEVFISFALDAGEDAGVPVFCFCTSSPCDLWTFLCVPKLIEAAEFPFEGNNLDVPIVSVPGMEGFLRRRDLPSVFRVADLTNVAFQLLLNEMQQLHRAQGLILNTFEELEEPILTHILSKCPKLYTVGPLHAHLKSRLAPTTKPIPTNNLWEEAKSCMSWLDAQPLRSVIYVSFGSLATVTKEELIEFWYGLINSGKRFLWVIRPDFVREENGDIQVLEELLEGTRERGYIVGWAPQEEVLAHQAIGGFLTHSGWNSTLESIVAGVPMLCWPYFADQMISSRFVGEVWKIGLDMKDKCDRIIIEKMIRDMMEERREQFWKSADQMAKLAKKGISEGGSSYGNLERLVTDIRFMGVQKIT